MSARIFCSASSPLILLICACFLMIKEAILFFSRLFILCFTFGSVFWLNKRFAYAYSYRSNLIFVKLFHDLFFRYSLVNGVKALGAKQIQLSEKTLEKIAEALFLAYTIEQAAYLGGISRSTLARIKGSPIWAEIERRSLEKERPFRKKILQGAPGWQGAAWMLERKYPGQLSKPEVQLSLNTDARVTNNTLVITAEQAQGLKNRNAILDEALSKLSPPASRSPVITPFMSGKEVEGSVRETSQDPVSDLTPSRTKSIGVVETPPATAPTRTPDARAGESEPKPPPKSKNLKSSTTKKKSVENSRNSDFIPPGGIFESPQSPDSIASGEKGNTKREQLLKSLEFSRKPHRQYHPAKNRGTENVSLPPAPRGPKAGRK